MQARNFVFICICITLVMSVYVDKIEEIEEKLLSKSISLGEELVNQNSSNVNKRSIRFLSPLHRRYHHRQLHGHRQHQWRDFRNHLLNFNHTPQSQRRYVRPHHDRNKHTSSCQFSAHVPNSNANEGENSIVNTPASTQAPNPNPSHEENKSDKYERAKLMQLVQMIFDTKEDYKLKDVANSTYDGSSPTQNTDLSFDIDIRK